MPRKGYSAEYLAKRKLITSYGEENVIKTASQRGIPDYIILNPIMGIEVKSSRKPKVYIQSRDIRQWRATSNWMKKKKAPIFYWMVTKQKNKLNISIITHDRFGREYIEPYIKKHGDVGSVKYKDRR